VRRKLPLQGPKASNLWWARAIRELEAPRPSARRDTKQGEHKDGHKAAVVEGGGGGKGGRE